jgi:hypothetical protein
MFRALTPPRRLKIEVSLLVSLIVLVLWRSYGALWRSHGTRAIIALLFLGLPAFLVFALVRIVNNWGRPRCKPWMFAAAGVLLVSLYGAAYLAMLKPRMVPRSLDGHRMSTVVNGVSFRPSFERDFCWGSLEYPARPEWLWRGVFWPAASVDRLVGLHPSLDEFGLYPSLDE